ncbi:hypothetical protein LL946_09055 [Knoellia locipacati]|uniref:hypothetical protein n=1 Tax=Knoellia locipacati TaxID=882824 RepID=UPI0038505D7A
MSGDQRAISRLTELIERVEVVEPDGNSPWRKGILEELEECRGLARETWRAEQGWPQVHSLEERVNARDTRLDFLAEQLGHHLANEPSATARRNARADFDRLQRQAQDHPSDTAKHARALERARAIIRDSHSRSRVKFDSARKTRIGLNWCAAALTVFAAITVFAQSRTSEAFVPLPGSSKVEPTLFLALLLGAGALGGMLSAMFSLYLTKDVEDTSWFDPRPALALTKVSVGAWASVIAAVAVGTGVLVGKFTSVPAALLIGVAFGYAQQALTGILDKHTAGLTEDKTKKT